MTASQRVKQTIIDVLTEAKPSASITVVDAKQRATYALPFIAVDVVSVSNYADDLPQVQRISMDIVLKVHAGDEDENDVEKWIADIEATLDSATDISSRSSDGITIYSWVYSGSSQEWEESVLMVNFNVECLAARA
jgi:glycerol-3-phosphate cytidylyltransferase-like family protein